ncbi:50S ribosomal protein L24 [Mycoplasma flocculare]|uniref:Large ribosomal subunit protein uL24 n=1 Tax=Mesomycoplasma flocculare TaxID=2128 RepID=A0AAW9XB17_MESFC|nr:50S ribosomal protein L24 [Mesomycoplasma flocculare]MXR39460.1 50S ribosomal protein L24 [Mycoplasma sp. MF12]MXR05869.1 50S ribosomal protein L24 [Mesomycoplasma flocculare]MXR12281.1 50S ribosomal protein L24 [Mesomycoplasma flocculare]MXR13496.1 50S ribosomal protein L24 [Mesomycoplasma flocculare]MXR22904.1 50S ribosomal protein L24 [Mesomycoplasma flocculare]
MAKIRKNDTVLVLSGDDKGKVSSVLEIIPSKKSAIVKGVNTKTKHKKPSNKNTTGEIVNFDAPILFSKLALVAKKATKDKPAIPTRVGFKFENGNKIRIAKKTGKAI